MEQRDHSDLTLKGVREKRHLCRPKRIRIWKKGEEPEKRRGEDAMLPTGEIMQSNTIQGPVRTRSPGRVGEGRGPRAVESKRERAPAG